MLNITDTEAAYIAGLIDGDGWISVSYSLNKKRPGGQFLVAIGVDQVDPRPLLWIHSKVGGGLFRIRDKRPNRRELTRWNCGGARAQSLLARLLPYLINKQEKAQIGLAMGVLLRKSKHRPISDEERSHRLRLVASAKAFSLRA